MEVELLEESCDPLHMPCVLKVEAVESREFFFEYQHDLLHTSINIKSESDDKHIKVETTHDTEMQLDVESGQTEAINIEPGCREENTSECLSDDDNNETTSLEETSSISDTKTETLLNYVQNIDNKNSSVIETPTIKSRSIASNKVDPKTRVKCQFCDIELNFSSLKRHIENIHETSQAYCVNISDKTASVKKSCNNEKSPIGNTTNTMKNIDYDNISSENRTKTINVKTHDTQLQELISSSRETINMINNERSDEINNLSLEKHINKECSVKNKKTGTNSNVSCPYCNVELQASSLRSHIQKVHKIYSKNCVIKCKFCGIKIKDRYLRMHIVEKHKSKSFSCAHCPLIFIDKGNLRLHITKIHMKRVKKIFTCSICPHVSKYKYNMKRHMTNCHNSIEILMKNSRQIQLNIIALKCTNCNQGFNNLINLKYHMKHKCQKIKFCCILCQESFKYKNALKNHVTEIHSNLNVSNSEFEQLFIQKLNINIAINNKLAFYVSNNRSNLVGHNFVRRISNTNLKVCYICGKVLLSERNLKLHLETHIHYLKCDNCIFQTKQKDDLIQHMKKSHLKLPQKCKICNLKADTNEDLQKHIYFAHNGKSIRCKYCSFETKHQYMLKAHMKYRHDFKKIKTYKNLITCGPKNGLFKCEICNKSFMLLSNLKNHIKNHLKLQNKTTKVKNSSNKTIVKTCEVTPQSSSTENLQFLFFCKSCNGSYKTARYLDYHQKYNCKYRLNGTRVFLHCDLCTYKTKVKYILATHLKHHHKFVNKFYTCKICGKKCTNKYRLNLHLKSHAGKNRKCNICKKEMNERSYDLHMNKMHNHKFCCPDCSDKFDSKLELRRHKISKHKSQKPKDPNARPYKCKICAKAFKNNSNLTSHTKNVHTESKSVICEECGKLYKNNETLKSHLLKIHAKNSELFACKFCDAKFLAKGRKISHEIVIHNKNKKSIDPQYKDIFKSKKPKKVAKIDPDLIPQLTCQFCGKIATSKCNLRAHIYTKHSDVKPFKCADCDKAFKYKRELSMHSMVHTQEKPFKCPTCDFATNGIQSLRCHIASKHVNI